MRPTVVGHIDLDSKGEPVRHKTEHKPESKTEPKPEPKATPAQAQTEKAESAPAKQGDSGISTRTRAKTRRNSGEATSSRSREDHTRACGRATPRTAS